MHFVTPNRLGQRQISPRPGFRAFGHSYAFRAPKDKPDFQNRCRNKNAITRGTMDIAKPPGARKEGLETGHLDTWNTRFVVFIARRRGRKCASWNYASSAGGRHKLRGRQHEAIHTAATGADGHR
jgi:hypothetical protein